MVIQFFPAQGERVPVAVPPHSSTIELQFIAAFASDKDYREARQDGVKVELWSNISMAHGGEGRWGAHGFEWATDHTSDCTCQCGGDTSAKCTSNPKVLDLRLRIPISRNQVEYTYRLVYPSGQIKWLGDYERNGVLVLERNLTQGQFFDSHVKEGTFSSGQVGWDNKQVIQLSQDVDWSIYAIREDGSVCMRSFV
jgi:hypothetical protein